MTGSLALDGSIELRRSLPDEEVFESLAARLRPVLLPSESVHHEKVLTALESIVEQQSRETEDLEALRAEVHRLRGAWSRHKDPEYAAHRYSAQRAKIDGSESKPQVSDSKLAMAWLYGDLVHVDVKGKKYDGTLLPIKERYAAAVSYFSEVALLCGQTFDVITDLADRRLLELDEQAMDVPVVVGSDELVSTGIAYVAPMDTPMPALDVASRSIPEGFRQLTVTELLRLEARNRVQVRLEAADGSTAAEYEAAASRHQTEDGRHVWRALVAGCVTYELSFDLDEDGPTSVDYEVTVAKLTTNRMALDKARFDHELQHCPEMRFIVSGTEFFSLSLSNTADEDPRDIETAIDSLEDLVSIETITGRALPVATGTADYWERAELRRIRLLWEGHVVPFVRGPVPTTAETGTAPQYLAVPAGTRRFADTEFPSPTFLVRHPRMVAESVRPIPDSDPPLESMQMVVPGDEPFVAWVPERCTVKGDTDLLHPTPWELSHFDSSPIFGSEWTAEQGLTM